jgi:hypothetical protein
LLALFLHLAPGSGVPLELAQRVSPASSRASPSFFRLSLSFAMVASRQARCRRANSAR